MTAALLGLAGLLILLGPRAGSDPVRARGRPSRRLLQLVCGLACAALLPALLGLRLGLAAAVLVVPTAAWFVGRLHARPANTGPSAALPLTLDLVAAALHAGRPLSAALELAAPVSGQEGEALRRVARLLHLGADPAEAWRAVDGDTILEPVAAAARRSATSGIRLAEAFAQAAIEVRAGVRAAAQARAARAGVLVAAPLGLCFLPSFVCLGIAPTVIGVVRTVFRSVA